MFNSGEYGGVSSPTLTNVTFSGNQAVNSGGAMYNLTVSGVSSPVIVNTILWGNDARYNPQVTNAGSVVPVFSYSLVQGGCPSLATCGDGMLYADPLFVQPVTAGPSPTTAGDYRLQFASPAIDTGNTLSVTVAADLDGNPRVVNHIVDMGAYEAQNVFTLHAGVAGQGTVAVDPQQDEYLYGTAVTLTAQAAAYHVFAGWRGDLDGTDNPATITITENKTVTAAFEILTYTLSLAADPPQGGTVSGAGVYEHGTAATLTAQPAAGYAFAGWRGDLDGTDNPVTITISENKTVTAAFEILTYTLSLAADPPQGGTVSGAGVYAHDAQAEASAAPAPGWSFVEWRENGGRVSGDALYPFAMTGDRALTAHFSQEGPSHRVLLPMIIRDR